jgi:hypothetical protein
MVRRCILHSSWPSQSCRWKKDMDVFLFLLILIYNSYRFNHHFAGWRDLDKFSCGNFFLGWIPPVFYLTMLQLQVSRCMSLSLVKELDFNVWANFLEFHRRWMMEQFSFAWHTYMRFPQFLSFKFSYKIYLFIIPTSMPWLSLEKFHWYWWNLLLCGFWATSLLVSIDSFSKFSFQMQDWRGQGSICYGKCGADKGVKS